MGSRGVDGKRPPEASDEGGPAAPDRLHGLRDVAVIWDIPITVVGEFAPGPPALLLRKGGTLLPLSLQSHDHFRSRTLRAPDAGRAEA